MMMLPKGFLWRTLVFLSLWCGAQNALADPDSGLELNFCMGSPISDNKNFVTLLGDLCTSGADAQAALAAYAKSTQNQQAEGPSSKMTQAIGAALGTNPETDPYHYS